ncbi:hypothetical protein PoB_003289700 [Plakobranchus ocellatus]|uniref:Uncharacterized protein n=1 Tax=Plakobranchus ocellatus TaxID=259542 RepID=A0AAV4AH93_9GAST|nr:hypothetical protein PoB_003289700 [Plakobranchus ocellatus]
MRRPNTIWVPLNSSCQILQYTRPFRVCTVRELKSECLTQAKSSALQLRPNRRHQKGIESEKHGLTQEPGTPHEFYSVVQAVEGQINGVGLNCLYPDAS